MFPYGDTLIHVEHTLPTPPRSHSPARSAAEPGIFCMFFLLPAFSPRTSHIERNERECLSCALFDGSLVAAATTRSQRRCHHLVGSHRRPGALAHGCNYFYVPPLFFATDICAPFFLVLVHGQPSARGGCLIFRHAKTIPETRRARKNGRNRTPLNERRRALDGCLTDVTMPWGSPFASKSSREEQTDWLAVAGAGFRRPWLLFYY